MSAPRILTANEVAALANVSWYGEQAEAALRPLLASHEQLRADLARLHEEHAAALAEARREERGACAAVADEMRADYRARGLSSEALTCMMLAAAIRARGQR